MIAVDTNILVYSNRQDSPHFKKAQAAIDSLRQNPVRWAIPWPCIHEFISVVTNPRIFQTPTPLKAAFETIDAWAAAGNLEFLSESPGYLAKLEELATNGQIKGAKIHDARIAALCLHHGINELWSCDRDFSLFPQLTIRSPL